MHNGMLVDSDETNSKFECTHVDTAQTIVALACIVKHRVVSNLVLANRAAQNLSQCNKWP